MSLRIIRVGKLEGKGYTCRGIVLPTMKADGFSLATQNTE
jgi:hypothetical protein